MRDDSVVGGMLPLLLLDLREPRAADDVAIDVFFFSARGETTRRSESMNSRAGFRCREFSRDLRLQLWLFKRGERHL